MILSLKYYRYSVSLALTGKMDYFQEVRLCALAASVNYAGDIQCEAKAMGFDALEGNSYLKEIEDMATNFRYSSIYAVAAIARGCGVDINLLYPAENGNQDEYIKICGGTFPTINRGKRNVPEIKANMQ